MKPARLKPLTHTRQLASTASINNFQSATKIIDLVTPFPDSDTPLLALR
jgi:hypothetical protein